MLGEGGNLGTIASDATGTGKDQGGVEADLRTYGENLGVDPEEDAELQWLVQEAFDAPLPIGWSEHTDDDGRIYFFNETSGESAWEHPMDNVYRELVKLVKQAQVDLEVSADEAARGRFVHEHLSKVHQRALEAIEGWSGPYLSEVGEYFYNATLKASVWENPLSRWEHELVLRHSVLCRCLLPERTLVSADGHVERVPQRGMSGPELLQALRLPLELVNKPDDRGEIPNTPSTTRSFHTARSICSTRSQLSSNRSGERRRSKEGKSKKKEERSDSHSSKEKEGRRSVSFEGQEPVAPPAAQEDRTTIFSRPAGAGPAAMVPDVCKGLEVPAT